MTTYFNLKQYAANLKKGYNLAPLPLCRSKQFYSFLKPDNHINPTKFQSDGRDMETDLYVIKTFSWQVHNSS